MNQKILRVFALITVISLMLAGCGGKEEAPAVTEPFSALEAPAATQEAIDGELGLSSWTLDASIWSSANGAAIDLTAVPTFYTEDMTATFVVRLEGEDIASNPCEWNGTAFTSFADLNAEDGYCYYVMLTDATHTVAVDINTPTVTTNASLINLAASLESFCHTTVVDSAYENGKLTITEGNVSIQVPQIVNGGEAVTCTAAELILNLDGGALTKESLNDKLTEADSTDASYTVDLAGISFSVPEMEDDHQLTLSLVVYLSDGTTLTDDESTSWLCSGGTIAMTVG